MINLCLHCGSNHADRQQVNLAPTPERTQSWVPISHGRLLDLVESTLDGHGLSALVYPHCFMVFMVSNPQTIA